MDANRWDAYETDYRAYILKLLGYSPFECDSYAHTRFDDLPERVKREVGASHYSFTYSLDFFWYYGFK